MKKLVFVLCIMIISCAKTRIESEPIYVEYFKQGQVLLPDYVCPDTLIVVNHVGLNKAIAYIEQTNSPLVETDDEIDSLFHQYCIMKLP